MPVKPYTGEEYRAEPDPIATEGGWALEDNPNKNYYDDRAPDTVRFIGMHITVGLHDITAPDSSAENTAQWGSTTATKASWHTVIDSDSIIPCLRDQRVAWAQGVTGYNFNRPGLGVEIGTDQTDWRKKSPSWIASTLRNVAIWLAPRIIRYDLPIKHAGRDRDAIQAILSAGGKPGFASHGDLDFVNSNRTDPGLVGLARLDTFPWEQLFTLVVEEVELRHKTHKVLLQVGSKGPSVVYWQKQLAEMTYPVGTIDGAYGQMTSAAVTEFQTEAGITVTGNADVETQIKMEEIMSSLLDSIKTTNDTLAQHATKLDAIAGTVANTATRTQVTSVNTAVGKAATAIALTEQTAVINEKVASESILLGRAIGDVGVAISQVSVDTAPIVQAVNTINVNFEVQKVELTNLIEEMGVKLEDIFIGVEAVRAQSAVAILKKVLLDSP